MDSLADRYIMEQPSFDCAACGRSLSICDYRECILLPYYIRALRLNGYAYVEEWPIEDIKLYRSLGLSEKEIFRKIESKIGSFQSNTNRARTHE